MSDVRIVTDSAADIDVSMAEELGISVVPMTVRFGREVYLHTELSNDAFWEKVEAGGKPGTSQPAVGLFEQVYERLVGAGHEVLCVTVTGRHSGTFSSASAAALRFGDRVRVLDSLSLSLGQGFQVLAAARGALQGMALAEVAQVAERVRERTNLLILLDSIEHIRRGGRVDALIPLLHRVTSMLHIKPVLNIVDGRLGLHALARSYERGLKTVMDDIAASGPLAQLAGIHTRCVEVAERVADALSERIGFPRHEIIVAETGPVLSVHAGTHVVGAAGVQAAE